MSDYDDVAAVPSASTALVDEVEDGAARASARTAAFSNHDEGPQVGGEFDVADASGSDIYTTGSQLDGARQAFFTTADEAREFAGEPYRTTADAVEDAGYARAAGREFTTVGADGGETTAFDPLRRRVMETGQQVEFSGYDAHAHMGADGAWYGDYGSPDGVAWDEGLSGMYDTGYDADMAPWAEEYAPDFDSTSATGEGYVSADEYAEAQAGEFLGADRPADSRYGFSDALDGLDAAGVKDLNGAEFESNRDGSIRGKSGSDGSVARRALIFRTRQNARVNQESIQASQTDFGAASEYKAVGGGDGGSTYISESELAAARGREFMSARASGAYAGNSPYTSSYAGASAQAYSTSVVSRSSGYGAQGGRRGGFRAALARRMATNAHESAERALFGDISEEGGYAGGVGKAFGNTYSSWSNARADGGKMSGFSVVGNLYANVMAQGDLGGQALAAEYRLGSAVVRGGKAAKRKLDRFRSRSRKEFDQSASRAKRKSREIKKAEKEGRRVKGMSARQKLKAAQNSLKGSATAAKTGGNALYAIGGAITSVPVLFVAGLLFVVLMLGGGYGGDSETSLVGLTGVEWQVANFFKEKGLEDIQIAAIMGNMFAESSMDPSCEETGGSGIGLCQWSGGRADALRAYAASVGKPVDDVEMQLDFFWSHDEYHLNWGSSYICYSNISGDPPYGSRVSGSKSGFLAAKDLDDAVEQFCYGWERPGIPRMQVRKDAAHRYLDMLSLQGTASAQAVIAAAKSQLGVPYSFGAYSPGVALDCSGLTKYAYSAAGIILPHQSQAQRTTCLNTYGGYEVSSIAEAVPGDLLVWSGTPGAGYGSSGHVAIYIGGGQMIEAPGYGSGVHITSVRTPTWICHFPQLDGSPEESE